MGTSNSSQPDIIYETKFSTYTKLLISISKRHRQFYFRIKEIVYEKKNNILFKVFNIKDNLLYYLEQIQIKDDQDIEMVLKKIQLSLEIKDGCFLNYNTSFATKHGSLVFIVYDYIELISLQELLQDNSFQKQRININQQIQSQIFSIFYLLNKQYLSIENLEMNNIFIYQRNGQINIKLVNIKLIGKKSYMQNSIFWKQENYEIDSLLSILNQLNNTNILETHDSEQLNAINNDLGQGKYRLQAVQDHFEIYQKQYKLNKIQNIQISDQEKKNLNSFLFNLNNKIKSQSLQINIFLNQNQEPIIFSDIRLE